MINYYLRRIKDNSIQTINKFTKGCWINVINPTKEELNELVTNYSLELDLLKDGLDNNEIPRFDDEDKAHYIYVKTISKSNEIVTLLIIIGQEFLITLSNEETKLELELQKTKHKFYTTQKNKTLLYWLLTNNYLFEQFVASETKIVNQKRYIENIKESDLDSLLNHEELLNKMTSAYTYMLHVYHKLTKRIDFYEPDKELIDDLIIDSEEAQNICLSSVKSISNIRDHYTLLLSNKLNKNIRILTIFTILVSISTAVSGIFGMNVILPFQTHPYTIFGILGLIIILTIVFIVFLKKKELF